MLNNKASILYSVLYYTEAVTKMRMRRRKEKWKVLKAASFGSCSGGLAEGSIEGPSAGKSLLHHQMPENQD